jgi:hypothetical protein
MERGGGSFRLVSSGGFEIDFDFASRDTCEKNSLRLNQIDHDDQSMMASSISATSKSKFLSDSECRRS